MSEESRSQDERDARIDDALASYPVAEPPPGFADRVLEAIDAHEQVDASVLVGRVARVTDNRWVKLAALVVAVAAVALVVDAFRDDETKGGVGHLVAQARTTTPIGLRGVAVAEAGAELSWQVGSGGAATVRQDRGEVFYRVDRGGAFDVETPLGVVSVEGTCFRVEIDAMKANRQSLQGAAVGAAIAAAVVVTVYEGRVVVAERGGQASSLGPGQSVALRGEPTVGTGTGEGAQLAAAELEPPGPNATREELLARDEAQRREIDRLRRRLDRAEAGSAGGAAKTDEDGRPWFDPSTETLRKFAAECRVRYDVPGFESEGEGGMPPEMMQRLGLTDEEKAGLASAVAKMRASVREEVRQLYLEATGDSEGADSLSISAMGWELQHKSPRGEVGRINAAIARERAGLAPPPADLGGLSPLERYFRLLAQLGDAVENEAAQVLGTERAHKLREELGGWGSRMEFAGCDDRREADEDR